MNCDFCKNQLIPYNNTSKYILNVEYSCNECHCKYTMSRDNSDEIATISVYCYVNKPLEVDLYRYSDEVEVYDHDDVILTIPFGANKLTPDIVRKKLPLWLTFS